jgi:hypothetical protein
LVAIPAFAQEEITESPLDGIAPEQALIVVLLGVGAGFLTAYQGYRTTPEDFDKLKFFDGVIYGIIGSVPLAIGSAMTVELDVFGYVMIFFAAIGVGGQIRKTRQKTIPSNATVTEITDDVM